MRDLPLVDLIYPLACLLCQHRLSSREACPVGEAPSPSYEAGVCEACRRAMPRLLPPVCRRCGLGLSGAYDARLVCPHCRQHPFAFDQARAPFIYVDAVREAVHAFKYRGHRRLGRWLAEMMAETARRASWMDQCDLIVPVPMHWLKTRVKGMNPAEWLAQALSRRLQRPCNRTALTRIRWTATQTRLSRPQRARNVAGAFRARPDAVTRRAVLLVDDVFTTGATAQACALALREAGATQVSVLTAATASSA